MNLRKASLVLLVLLFSGFFLLASLPRLSYALDHPVLSGDKRVSKTSARIGDIVTVTIDINGSGVPVPMEKIVKHPVDIVIMMDSSESYIFEIRAMQADFTELISDLESAGLNATFGFISFGNSLTIGECPINKDGSVNAAGVRQLTKNSTQITEFIKKLWAWGMWEPWGDAIYLGNHYMTWRPDAYKIAVLVTDEPCDEGRKIPGPLTRTVGVDYNGSLLWNEVKTAASNKIRYITIDSGAGLTTKQLKGVANITDGLYYEFSHVNADQIVKVINDTITEVVQDEQKGTAGHEIIVSDVVSSQVELVSGSFNPPPTSQTVNPGGTTTLEWDLPDVKYDESVRITYDIRMIAPGEIPTNAEAEIAYLDWEGNPASIQLPIPVVLVSSPIIESCDINGTKKDIFTLSETVYINGTNFGASHTYDVYVVKDLDTWNDGMTIPPRINLTATNITTDGSGKIVPTALWVSPLSPGKYDIVVDVNGNGKYDEGVDALDDGDVEVTAGLMIVPELWLGTVLASVACFAALGSYRVFKNRSTKRRA